MTTGYYVEKATYKDNILHTELVKTDTENDLEAFVAFQRENAKADEFTVVRLVGVTTTESKDVPAISAIMDEDEWRKKQGQIKVDDRWITEENFLG